METESITLSREDEKIIDEVLKAFASLSAYELELITTTDFVARELSRYGNKCTDQEIIEGVRIIKGEKFSSEKIHEAVLLLRKNGYRWN